MMDMTYNTGWYFGLGVLHVIAMIGLVTGIVLLLLWAAKTLTPAKLKTWGITLLGIGIVACIVCCYLMGTNARWQKPGMMMNEDGGMMHMQMMDKMMMNQGSNTHDMNMMHGDDMMSMSMDDMGAMLKGKTGDAFDKAFIEGMIPHHQGAIDMANAALRDAKHEEIKKLARDIIASQQKEIDAMKQWQKDWGYTN